MATGFGGSPHEGVLTNKKHTKEKWISYSVLGGVKRLVDGYVHGRLIYRLLKGK